MFKSKTTTGKTATTAAATPLGDRRRQWPHIEYRAQAIQFSCSMASLTEQLNVFGKEGWEVVEVQWQNGNEHAIVLMRREHVEAAETK